MAKRLLTRDIWTGILVTLFGLVVLAETSCTQEKAVVQIPENEDPGWPRAIETSDALVVVHQRRTLRRRR